MKVIAPDLINHRTIAKRIGTRTQQVSRWVQLRIWPPPHSEFGATKLYRVTHFEHFLATGHWPPEAWPEFSRKRPTPRHLDVKG